MQARESVRRLVNDCDQQLILKMRGPRKGKAKVGTKGVKVKV